MDPTTDFVELLAKTHYSFLEGASSPEELFSTAAMMGYAGLGIADVDGLYGIARAHTASKKQGIPLYVGTQIPWKSTSLHLFAMNRKGYGDLCELLSCFHQELPWELESFSSDLLAFIPATPFSNLDELQALFPRRLAFFCSLSFEGRDAHKMKQAETLIDTFRLPCIASNEPLYHIPQRKILHDVLRSIKHLTPLTSAGFHLTPNNEKYLKSLATLSQLYKDHPEWLRATKEFASLCTFSLDELRYHYPREWLPEGHTSDSYLRELVEKGALHRFGKAVSSTVSNQIEHELSLIKELHYADYFLTIWDIVQFASSKHILFQGRGSAANSLVCYLLGITAIDPIRMNLLFERFISKERHEPPDIDIDFEHERREEVIQYIYTRYGRARAALTAEVICFRKKSALREVGKTLGIRADEIERFQLISKKRPLDQIPVEDLQGESTHLSSELLAKYLALCQEIYGLPRHLGTHVGGFVLSQEKLSRMIPIEKAAQASRTIVQWDKNDLDNLNFTRVDILGLGILTAIRKCFELIQEVYQVQLSLSTIPAEDPKVYDAICKADTVGVFQIESRAQMNMLPRLKPRTFYDLVVQVAIVRPGPIQGEMVHPYLRRRQGLEEVDYPHPELEAILKKTYGVPLFQEQIMKMAMTVAGFSGGEADELRRAMGIWRRDGKNRLSLMGEKFRQGLIKKGISQEFADRIFSQIEGFAEYGFPESHAASFALLAYASAYLKVYYPDAYMVALLNSQPMGFYNSHTLLYDAMRHGVTVQPIDINFSAWDNSLISPHLIRLGFREIFGLRKSVSQTIERLRKTRPFFGFSDFISRMKEALAPDVLTKRDLFFLASSDCFQSVHLKRREAFWEIQKLGLQDSFDLKSSEDPLALPPEKAWEKVTQDFHSFGISLGEHPMAVLRSERTNLNAIDSRSIHKAKNNQKVKHAGMVVSRQMPPTANGVLFLTLEDEWGLSNLIVWKDTAAKYKQILWTHSFLLVEGTIQRDPKSQVLHLIVTSVSPL
ncbi:MAG: DNA polymerase III subunit alpha [Proteobacteria bacterium]|nr:DNA polymerase III subunit alpha [Pseudomonadota bacterium]